MTAVLPAFPFFIRQHQRTKMSSSAFWFGITGNHYFRALNIFYFQPFLTPVSPCILAVFFLGDNSFQSLFFCFFKKGDTS